MKFIEKISNIGRIGTFSELPLRWQGVKLKTPMCLTYTSAGVVPHLMYDVLQHLNMDSRRVGLMLQPLPTIVDFTDAVQEQGAGLGEFVGLSEYPHHVSMQDPATLTPSGYNVKKGASVWTHGGKKMLYVKDFMTAQRAFRPFSYQALCDSDTPYDCSKKRLSKAVDNTLAFLDECLEEHFKSKELSDTAIFGSVQGGYEMHLRRKSAEETAKRAVDGFVIDGFHINGPEVRNMDFSKIKPLLMEVVNYLPSDKPRMLNGPFRPSSILEAIKCGVDIFDSSYPYVLSNCGQALILPSYNEQDTVLTNIGSAKCAFEMDLNETSFCDDFSPILKGCMCYTCNHFTRAYIHHLLVTSELLANVLLMLHNMYQFYEFFNHIQQAMELGSFEKIEKAINAYEM